MEITPACYSHFTSSLMGLAGGKIAVVLEACIQCSSFYPYFFYGNERLFHFDREGIVSSP